MATAFLMAALAGFAQQDTTTVTVIHSGDGNHQSDTIRIGGMTIIKNDDGSHKPHKIDPYKSGHRRLSTTITTKPIMALPR